MVGTKACDSQKSMNKRACNVNEGALEKLTPRTAWVIGWYASDGCVASARPIAIIALGASDIDVIEQIQSVLGHDGRIKIREYNSGAFKKGEFAEIRIQSTRLVNSLARFEVFPRKSGKQPFPKRILNSSEACIRSFVRGYFEGNGSISITHSRPKISFCGSHSMMADLTNYFHAKLGVRKNPPMVHSQSNVVSQVTWKCHGALVIADWMYKNADLYCRRKRDKYLAIKSQCVGRFKSPKWMGEGLDGKIGVRQLTVAGRLVAKWPSLQAAADAVGTTATTIHRAVRGIRKTALGYRWKLA